jgi:glycosyltransferase involved in cell wall biosynthesis
MNELISIVVPLHNEADSVPPLVAEILNAIPSLRFEVLLVDDGSTDETFAAVRRASASDARLRGIRLRRNFGQAAAIKAGIDSARGTILITMDGDLQHDPAAIPAFLEAMAKGSDMVCSFREHRDDGLLRRFPSSVANLLARLLTGLKLRDFGSTFRAYRTDVARELPIYGEMHRFIPVFGGMLTNRITEVPIRCRPRRHGRTNYPLSRTLRVISDLFTLSFFFSFFNRPIHIFGYIAALLGLPGIGILAWLTFHKIVNGISIMDRGPLFFLGVMLTLVSGQMLTTGIVCEYLLRIYYRGESRRPYSTAEIVGEPSTRDAGTAPPPAADGDRTPAL